MRVKSFLLFCSLLLLSVHFYGQKVFSYDSAWKKIDNLIDRKSLPRSALTEVNKVYAMAQKERREDQWIKAAVYRIQLTEEAQDESPFRFSTWDSAMAGAPARVKAVLQSAEATALGAWVSHPRFYRSRQTNVSGDSSSDVRTWSQEKISAAVQFLYLQSLADKALLQHTALNGYEAILIKGNARNLRPTLYDLLVYRALDYFTANGDLPGGGSGDALKPDLRLFTTAKEFTGIDLRKADSSSPAVIALRLYQDVISAHLADADPSAFVDADIRRIQFVYSFSVAPKKEQHYLSALTEVVNRFPKLPAVTQAGYLIAYWHFKEGGKYDPMGDTTTRFELVKAAGIARQFQELPDSSEGKTNCRQLLKDILRKDMTVSTESVNVPDLPFRILLSFKNLPQLHARIIRIDEATRKSLVSEMYQEKTWRKLVNYPTEKKFDFTLPDTRDYQQHRVELPIDALPVGEYALLTSSDPAFGPGSSMAVNFFFCSNIAYVWHGKDCFVADRTSGKPLAGVKVNSFAGEYTKKAGKPDGKFVTDASGHFKAGYPDDFDYNNHYYTFVVGQDLLSTTEMNSLYYRSDDEDDDEYEDDEEDRAEYRLKWLRSSFFTDRGIYRPGQSVFVKTLLTTREFKTGENQPATGMHSKLYLSDANGQHIDSVSYVSSSFGSFSTVFHLPASGLTGNFSVSDSITGSDVGFSVEEYKRPKFFVTLDTPSGTLHLNDSVLFKGEAKAYAGNVVDGAKVVYRVYREASFPYPWFFRAMPGRQEQEMTQGETTADAEGKFNVSFKAIPDLSLSSSAKPVFTYRIVATVTDRNGETREGNGRVSVSAQSFQIYSPLAKEGNFPADSLTHFPVTTQDANGRFIAKNISVSVYSLAMPDRLIRNRYWNSPDLHLTDKTRFLQLFPHDEYDRETDKTTWPVSEKIYSSEGTTRADGTFPLSLKNAQRLSGWFLFVFSGVDSNGDSIVDKRWIALGQEKTNKPLYPQYLIQSLSPDTAAPGRPVAVSIGTAAAAVTVFRYRGQVEDSLSAFSEFRMNNEVNRQMLPVTEKDRGGFVIEDMFIRDNRVFTSWQSIEVPWSNKELSISFKTWKDKTLPGEKETWTVRVEGEKKKKVEAELLTAMYDASLDAFMPMNWNPPGIYPVFSPRSSWQMQADFGQGQTFNRGTDQNDIQGFRVTYDAFIDRQMNIPGRYPAVPMMIRGVASNQALNDVVVVGYAAKNSKSGSIEMTTSRSLKMPEAADSVTPDHANAGDPGLTAIRKNFNETAFFLPDLHTNAEGDVSFSFSMPEALTKWKWLLFAHTKDLSFGLGEKSVITQKELMLQPNMPRFLRQGDSLLVPVKIANLSTAAMTGHIRLDWRDAGDSSERNTAFGNRVPEQAFTVPAGQSKTYFFPASIAGGQSGPVYYRLLAKTDGTTKYEDGEEGILPVLSNRRLVTETLPIRLNRETAKTYEWEKLLKSGDSKTLEQHSLNVEYSTRPAWFAVQSLPYLMEFPYECAEQTFDRYYANALGRDIVSKIPGMAGVMAAWRSGDSAALQSNLQKNEELKTVLLKETPWVVEAQGETAQKQRLATLMDTLKLNSELKNALSRLQGLQSASGGFPWFAGGREDRYITQYIVSGVGHLMQLKAMPASDRTAFNQLVKKALVYLDGEINRDYQNRPKIPSTPDIGPEQIQYLYMRSFFRDIDIPGASFFAVNYYRQQAQKYWSAQNMYLRGMIALFLNRNGDKKTAQDIMKSLRENAISSEKDGMYWKRPGSGYYWQESPVETQSLLIEAFAELGQTGETEDLKWWLLQQKQATHWNSTKSTADACYALLLNGADWLAADQSVDIHLGAETISSRSETTQAGTGYFKKSFPAEKVAPSMGHVSVTAAGAGGKTVPSFGAVYWQYFEDFDRIIQDNTVLGITRTIFLQKNTDKGVVGELVSPGATLHVGDRLLLRFIIKTDRDLSYVQLHDQRASCLEPVDALSGYRWQGDLGFYQAPGDESTSFFFDYLPKGTHVVEYPVFVSANGAFSGGISTLQTMYAPEFAGHTAGSRLRVTEK